MTDHEFIKWAEDFFVDVEWTPNIRKRLLNMLTALDSRVVEVEVPTEKVVVKHVIRYLMPDGRVRGYNETQNEDIKIGDLLCLVASRHGLAVDKMISRSRKRELVDARAEFVSLARGYSFSYRVIAEAMNRTNHSTAMHLEKYRKGSPYFTKLGHGKGNPGTNLGGTEGDQGGVGKEGKNGKDNGGFVRTPDASEVQVQFRGGIQAVKPDSEKLSKDYSAYLL